MYGELIFNAPPPEPHDTKLVGHIKTNGNYTNEINIEVSCYVGSSIDNYRCFYCYYFALKKQRIMARSHLFQLQHNFKRSN